MYTVQRPPLPLASVRDKLLDWEKFRNSERRWAVRAEILHASALYSASGCGSHLYMRCTRPGLVWSRTHSPGGARLLPPEEGNTAGRLCCSSSMPSLFLLPLWWCSSAGKSVVWGERCREGKGGARRLSQEGLGGGSPSWCVWADVDSNAGHLLLAVRRQRQDERLC